jgi:hypothetical protein
MTSDLETFQKGATAFRNAADLTEEKGNEAVKHANKRAKEIYGEEPTTVSTVL